MFNSAITGLYTNHKIVKTLSVDYSSKLDCQIVLFCHSSLQLAARDTYQPSERRQDNKGTKSDKNQATRPNGYTNDAAVAH